MNFKILDDQQIPYKVIRKNNLRLTIKYDDYGVLKIIVPNKISLSTAKEFVESHIDWIKKNKPVKDLPHLSYHDFDTYLLLGVRYQILICYSNYEEILINDNILYIYTRNDAQIPVLLEKFRTNKAAEVMNELLYHCFEKVKEDILLYPSLIIKKSKSRWGACFFKENKIMLNISLIHVPLHLIEYVIYHELSHFVYPNHSQAFHQYLKNILPNELELKRELKNYNIVYK